MHAPSRLRASSVYKSVGPFVVPYRGHFSRFLGVGHLGRAAESGHLEAHSANRGSESIQL